MQYHHQPQISIKLRIRFTQNHNRAICIKQLFVMVNWIQGLSRQWNEAIIQSSLRFDCCKISSNGTENNKLLQNIWCNQKYVKYSVNRLFHVLDIDSWIEGCYYYIFCCEDYWSNKLNVNLHHSSNQVMFVHVEQQQPKLSRVTLKLCTYMLLWQKLF